MNLYYGTVLSVKGLTATVQLWMDGGQVTYPDTPVLQTGSLSGNRFQCALVKGDQVACLVDESECLVLGAVGGDSDASVGDLGNAYLTKSVVLGDPSQTLTGVTRSDDLVTALNTLISVFNGHTHAVTVAGVMPGTGSIAVTSVTPSSTMDNVTADDFQSDTTKVGG